MSPVFAGANRPGDPPYLEGGQGQSEENPRNLGEPNKVRSVFGSLRGVDPKPYANYFIDPSADS